MICLGLDIGGANLKAATNDGWHANRSFPLWREPARLASALAELIADAPKFAVIAATMTGELADCFRTKAEGVREISRAVRTVAGARPVGIYRTDGQFASIDETLADPLPAAASNWHALASFVAKRFEIERGLLIDLGSTTCDFIPIAARRPASRGATDLDRLLHGELVYTGVGRSPVCAICRELPYRGQQCPVAQEFFATSLDAYLILGEIPEDASDHSTADGRPATREFALERLARCLCADREKFDAADALAVARAIKESQLLLLGQALERALPAHANTVVISGQGEFLARELLERRSASEMRIESLSERLGFGLSQVAPAFAVAILGMEAMK